MNTVRHVTTLDYCDGPILFEARNRIGGRYLAVAIEDRDGEPTYAVVGVSRAQLQEFRNGMLDLRHLLAVAGSEKWYVAQQDRATGRFVLELQPKTLLDNDFLPDEGNALTRS